MLVRTAKPSDVPAMMALADDFASAAHWNEYSYRQIFELPRPRRLAFILESGTSDKSAEHGISGFVIALAEGPEWEIENIVVGPGSQRRGCGSHLLRALLDKAREERVSRIFLEVRESNVAARAFYAAATFTVNGRRKSYYRNPEEDALLMEYIFA